MHKSLELGEVANERDSDGDGERRYFFTLRKGVLRKRWVTLAGSLEARNKFPRSILSSFCFVFVPSHLIGKSGYGPFVTSQSSRVGKGF